MWGKVNSAMKACSFLPSAPSFRICNIFVKVSDMNNPVQLVRILSSDDPLLAQVPALYESAFPKQARIPTKRLLELIDERNMMMFYCATVNDEFCGMASVWTLKSHTIYFHYLAILESMRNRGLGAQAVAQVLQRCVLYPTVGEVEAPVTDLQKRRLAFYLRNNFSIASENPTLLNAAHPGNDLYLISNKNIDYCLEDVQREIIEQVYSKLHE